MKLTTLLELHQKEKPQLSQQTINKYQSVIRLFTKDADIDHIFISHDHIIQWRNKIFTRSSAGNCNNYHRHLKALFNTAVKLGYLDKNIFKDISMLKVEKEKCKTVSDQTIKEILLLLKSDKYYSQHIWFYLAMIDTFRFTAIRRRQLIGIRWNDINFKKQTLRLDSKFSKNGIENLVPLNKALISHFKIIKNNIRCYNSCEQVFNITKLIKTYKSDIMTGDHVSRLFSKWSKKIGKKVSPHRFRHATATKIANSGCNLKSLQRLLGHQDIKTTMGYIEINIDDLRKIQSIL